MHTFRSLGVGLSITCLLLTSATAAAALTSAAASRDEAVDVRRLHRGAHVETQFPIHTARHGTAHAGRDQVREPMGHQRALASLRKAERILLSGTSTSTSAGAREAQPETVRDGTLLLRELTAALPSLRGDEKTRARALLARPTDGAADPEGFGYSTADQSACSTNVCVHWVNSTTDAPPVSDTDSDGTPDWVETTGVVLEEVWAHIVNERGYRPPLPDTGSPNPGPDGRLDVYLADIGNVGYYGMCVVDDPAAEARMDVSGYCVLDNDFSAAQFDGAAPYDSLRVTAAHEFFHAVQFGYDWWEDPWMMEGTAAWMEGDVYPDLNDNLQYLDTSALVHPEVPVDYVADMDLYGSWIFWQFLTEYYGSATAARPDVIRALWELADGAPGGPDLYSLAAVRVHSEAHDISFSQLFADFAGLSQISRRWYFDGNLYPQASLNSRHTFSASRLDTGGWWRRTQDHLTSSNVGFVAKSSVTGSRRLRITVDAPGTARGSAAQVMVHRRSGAISWFDVALDRSGSGVMTVPFTRSKVSRVVLTLVNASTRMECWVGTSFACGGVSRDDRLKFYYKAQVIR